MPLKLLLLLAFCAPQARAALSPNAESALDNGLKGLYGLDYEQSRAAFRKLIEQEPDNPWGYLFEAGGIWWQSAMEYGLFKDTPTLQGLFEEDIEAAIRKADPLTDSPSREIHADGHFIAGMALGTQGQWSVMKGHWVKAYFTGKKALKHLKKCVRIDRDYSDAYLGLGVYDYQAAQFGGLLKLTALVGGIHGNEKRGLERIAFAMNHGRYSSRQAAQFLSTIYIIDKRDYAKGLALIQGLRKDFPESVYFQFLEVVLRQKLLDWDGSLEEGRSLFDNIRTDPKAFNRKLLSLVCSLTGEKCLDYGSAQQALMWFNHAIESTPQLRKRAGRRAKDAAKAEEQWLSLNHLYRAYSEDLLGMTDEAARDYQWVLAHPDFSDNHARAKECLEISCDRDSFLKYLRALSHDEPWPPKNHSSAKP